MAAGGLSLSSLTEEFQETKKRLKEVEEGIQKHTGRPSLQQRLKPRLDAPIGIRSQLASRLDDGPFRRHQGGPFSRLGRQLNANELREMGPTHSQGPQKNVKRQRDDTLIERERSNKKDETRANEDEEDEEDDPPRKIGLQSLIGASSMTVKQKSRSELLNEQRSDASGKERNKRMFGMILGTLKSFEKEETTKRKEQVDKKVEKEQKVEEMKQKEREEDIRQRRELLTEKREKIIQLKKLHSKMEVVGAFEEFSKRHKYMMNFIHTSAKPPVMWLPKSHTKETEKLLARSKAKIQVIIEKEQERMLLEVERIEGITRASDGEPEEKENSHLPSSVAVVVKHDETEASIMSPHGDSKNVKTVEANLDSETIKIVIENDLKLKSLNGDRKHEVETSRGERLVEKHSRSPSNRSHRSTTEPTESTTRRSPIETKVATERKENDSTLEERIASTTVTTRERSRSTSHSSMSSSRQAIEKNEKLAAAKVPKHKRVSPDPKASSPAREKSPPARRSSPSPKRVHRVNGSPKKQQTTSRSSSTSSSSSSSSSSSASDSDSSSGGSNSSIVSPKKKKTINTNVAPRKRSRSPKPKSRSPKRSSSPAPQRFVTSHSSNRRRRSGSPVPAKKAARKRSPSPQVRSRSPRRMRRSRSPRRRR